MTACYSPLTGTALQRSKYGTAGHLTRLGLNMAFC